MNLVSAQILARREGFANQKLVVLPDAVVRSALEHSLLRGLIPVAAGYFPSAERHLVERVKPLADAILILCASGRGRVWVGGGEPELVETDTLVFVPPGQAHSYGADVDPWSIYWVHVRGEEVAGFQELFSIGGRHVVHLPQGTAERTDFARIYERLEEDYTVPNLLSAAARLRMILAELNRLQLPYPAPSGPDPIGRTIVWMREHLDERVTLSRLARKAGLSAAQYSVRFRRKTGYSPVDYCLRMKVQHACRLLDTTDMRVEDVAAAAGYDDPFYFSRLFRRFMAKSPRAYRAEPKG